jgi:hypothetical protein
MNKKLKAKWLRALRSGSYRQTSGELANEAGTRFCCLGVLADIQGCTWRPSDDGDGLVPVNKANRAIVPNSNDWLPPTRAGGLTHDQQEKLASMNDDGKSFKQIAGYIEVEH